MENWWEPVRNTGGGAMEQNGQVVIDGTLAEPARPGVAVRALSKGQKAAVIVRLLLSEDVALPLNRLTPEQQQRLARHMASLRHVNRATLAEVLKEFTAALDGLALTFPSGLPDALEILDPYLSETARDELKTASIAIAAGDPWARLADMDVEALRPLIEQETAEVCAILLSKLGVAKAAALLSDVPPERAEVIAHAVSLTGTVAPQMVARIGETLVSQIDQRPAPAFKASAVERVGAILNSATSALRDSILSGLEARDAAFAAEVRRAIFTFAHIPKRVEPGDVPKVMRMVEGDLLILALAAGMETAPLSVEFLLENMSKRMAEQLREEAEAAGTPRPEEGEPAMNAVVAAIRELEESGEIRLIPPED